MMMMMMMMMIIIIIIIHFNTIIYFNICKEIGIKLDNKHWCVQVPKLETIPKSK
jgi:hypothetical protein